MINNEIFKLSEHTPNSDLPHYLSSGKFIAIFGIWHFHKDITISLSNLANTFT
jgi:hypothetical protein